jgi:hypothetical protein
VAENNVTPLQPTQAADKKPVNTGSIAALENASDVKLKVFT